MQIKISVIIPCYNSEKFITKTLQSVLSQTIYPDEIILIDDGSTDNTAKIIESIIIKHNHKTELSLIKSKQHGPGYARNIGIKNAKYEWIAFLDSDDYWEKNKIEIIYKYIKQNKNINFLCHNEYMLTLNGVKKVSNYSKFYKKDTSLFNQIYYKNYFSTSAVVCKRKLLLDNNLFNINLMSAQDYELWIRMSDKINLFFIPEVLGNYIERKGNITSGNLYNRMINEILIANMYKQKAGLKLFLLRLARIFSLYVYYYLRRLIS
mgnify:CR=1 FL=1